MIADWLTIRDVTASDNAHFESCASDLELTQQRILFDILARNHDTEYANQYKFCQLDSVYDYQSTVPIVVFNDIEDQIDAQTRGQKTLCSDPVIFYEQTSGSTTVPKRLPYTEPSLKAIQQAVNPWLHDLATSRTNTAAGLSYWSISPAGRPPDNTPDGTPIGAPSDLAFLTPSLQAAFLNLFAVPPQVGGVEDVNEWRYLTLMGLIAEENLSLISIWNPSFLSLLIAAIPTIEARFIHDLTCEPKDRSVEPEMWHAIMGNHDAKSVLKRFQCATEIGQVNTKILWPKLDTISCWMHGSAMHSFDTLQSHFPSVYCQPKGLLATEAVVTFPLEGTVAPVLAVNSAFFEFRDDSGTIFLAHQLKLDESYCVIVTTYGGLYRYNMGDVVVVRGYYKELPCLEFVGRLGQVSDLQGEKLNDVFVTDCLGEISGFSLLISHREELNPDGYHVLVDSNCVDAFAAESIASHVEKALLRNPQYAYARHLGQLAAVTVIRIYKPESLHQDFCAAKGLSLGDIKPTALCVDPELASYLLSAAVDDCDNGRRP